MSPSPSFVCSRELFCRVGSQLSSRKLRSETSLERPERTASVRNSPRTKLHLRCTYRNICFDSKHCNLLKNWWARSDLNQQSDRYETDERPGASGRGTPLEGATRYTTQLFRSADGLTGNEVAHGAALPAGAIIAHIRSQTAKPVD